MTPLVKGKKEKRAFRDAAKPGRADWTGTAPKGPAHLWRAYAAHSDQAITQGWIALGPSAGFCSKPGPGPELKGRNQVYCYLLVQIGYHLMHSKLKCLGRSTAFNQPRSARESESLPVVQ